MKCPNCNIALVMVDRQGVEIDYFPQCREVWLDGGELDKIIERSSDLQRREHDDDLDDHHKYVGNDDHYPKKRRKSLLGELFNF